MPHLHYDVFDLHLREVLAVTDGPLVLLLALELEDDHFIAPAFAENGAGHARRHRTETGNYLPVVAEHREGLQLDLGAGFPGQSLHTDHVAGRNPVLLAA